MKLRKTPGGAATSVSWLYGACSKTRLALLVDDSTVAEKGTGPLQGNQV